jgi:hypothetical protein
MAFTLDPVAGGIRFDGGAGYPLNNDAGAGTIDMLEECWI